MYHLYNLIEQGDFVRAMAVRRVQSESTTGSVESHRIRLNLTIQVTKVAFDASSSSAPPDPLAGASGSSTPTADEATSGALGGGSGGDGVMLQVSGRVIEENQHVKMGAFHTLDLEVHRPLTITKESWDSVHLERLSDSTDVGQRAEVGAVVLGEGERDPRTRHLPRPCEADFGRIAGTGIVCLLTENMTVVRQRIDVAVPRKRKGLPTSAADKATARFYTQVYNAVLKLLQLPAIRLIILASPGFTKESVYEFIFSEATKRGDKQLIGNDAKRKFIKIHCNSPHLHSLMEVIRSPEVTAQLKDTKFAKEGQLLDKFLRMLSADELRAWYGERHVLLAASRGAIGSLLISDGLFRAADPARRKQFVQLVEDVRTLGGSVAIFSSMHESGRQLNGLTGIAAILTFPLDIEVVEEEEREAEEQARKEKAAQAKANGEDDGLPPLPPPNTNIA